MKYLETFLKWFLQIGCMVSDIVIIGFAIALIVSCFKIGSGGLWIISIILLAGAYSTWKKQGGFIAWRKKDQKAFFTNWDKIMEEK